MSRRLAIALVAVLPFAVGSASAQQTLMASPTCEELTIMDFLARLDDPTRVRRILTVDEKRNLSQVKRDVCAPYVGYRVTRAPTTTWTNGRPITRSFRELNHPNGRIAKNSRGEWFYPSGPKARSALGRWEYANGMPARPAKGIWYTREGKYIEDPDKARLDACIYLGKELCPLGKADEDLLSITIMGLINWAGAESVHSKGKESKDTSSKAD
jgi:hypothetical protein